jgi:hypothetical protein
LYARFYFIDLYGPSEKVIPATTTRMSSTVTTSATNAGATNADMDMIPSLNHHTSGTSPSSTFIWTGELSAAPPTSAIHASVTKTEPSMMTAAGLGVAPALESKLSLSLLDSLPSHGPITALAFSLGHNGDKPVPELVTSTGVDKLGGFTLWQSTLPIYTKRKIHAICGTRGVWSLAVKQPISSGGGSTSKGTGRGGVERGGGSDEESWDTVLIGTDGVPSPGLSRVSLLLFRSPLSRVSGVNCSLAYIRRLPPVVHHKRSISKNGYRSLR